MPGTVAKIALSAATYWIDKPYSYAVPEELSSSVCMGKRVYVPFSRGNRRSEGVVLSVSEESTEGLKSIESVLDETPVLTDEQIALALFMRDHYFCTAYDAFRVMLPAGMWFNDSGSMRVKDKITEYVRLEISAEEAAELAEKKKKTASRQSIILRELSMFEELPVRELLSFTGTSRPALKALVDSGCCSIIETESFRRPEGYESEPRPIPVLNDGQNRVFLGIKELVSAGKAGAALLQGVTGSGKTSVYIKLIDDVLSRGKSAVLLVPEIALTPQMLRTFSSYFGDNIAVMHSSLTLGERFDEWKRIKNGKARLVIGTRSAVFAPVDNPGIFIIDEEQEDTYKSENSPRYNAQDIAKFRCVKNSCLLLLGSATPRVSSRYMAETGKYSFFRLDSRYNDKRLPDVSIVDMKEELRSGNPSSISLFLRDEIQKNIDSGEQTILFLNRRGANRLVTCGECGYIYKCPNCSVSLTYHTAGSKLTCHYCGYTRKPDRMCPDCGGILRYVGAGTQLIENELRDLFPDSEVMRMDADAVSRNGGHRRMFDRFRNENIPIMIGTQMVTKGLNFENVTLVGVISADQSLYTGDFRASERTFSLITQVVGRGGRGEKAGRAVIQTFTPHNETICQAAVQNYDEFYDSEIAVRRLNDAPPFSMLLCVTASGEEEIRVLDACRCVKARLEFLLKDIPNTDILGPTPLNVVRVNNRFRYRINLRCDSSSEVRRILANVMAECNTDKRFRGISFYADSDPND